MPQPPARAGAGSAASFAATRRASPPRRCVRPRARRPGRRARGRTHRRGGDARRVAAKLAALPAPARAGGCGMSPVRRRVGAILRPYRRQIAYAGLGIVGSTVVTVAAPLLLRYAIDSGVRKHRQGPIDRAALVYVALALARPLLERLVVLSSA